MAAESALPVFDLFCRYRKVGSMDDLFLTSGAEGRIHLVARDISDINVFQSFLLCNLVGPLQSFNRGGRKIGQFIIREKAIEVERDSFTEIVFYPEAHPLDIHGVIIQCGNDEIDDFQMSAV